MCKPPKANNAPSRAMAGSVLLVVVVLLLLASLFVAFALNVGKFEQQTSGNDVRAKLVQEIADSGMNQGVEYFNANRGTVVRDASKWQACAATDTSFPCGAAPAARRSTMMRFVGGTGTGGVEVPIPNPITSTGNFPATQQVGAVICWVKRISTPAATPVTSCTTNADEASTTWVLTVVSKGSLTGEKSSATVAQTVGAYSIFALSAGIPPVIASGSVAVGGGLQIVAAPNAAGVGVPVSVWTRLDMTKNGTPNTCYMDEFLRNGGTSSGPTYFDGIDVCDTCSCPSTGSLSYPMSGNKACEGMDIVDIDNNVANDCAVAPNKDIRRIEFPPDLFAFIFGQRAWEDIDQGVGGDTFANKEFNFGEKRIIEACTFPFPGTGAPTTMVLPADTCYLLNIKVMTHIGDGINDAAECAALGPTTQGIVWVHSQSIAAGIPGYDCDGKIRQSTIGSPSHPVALIHDGALTQVNGLKLFGLLYLREPNASTTLDKDTGGTANFGINGNANIYGAVVVQGQVTSGGGGTAAIVYNEKVLNTLITDPSGESPTSLPGSWTDELRY